MNLAYYVVDAFATKVFEGNPAAVFILPEWLPEDLMQKIAIENNLSETAFAVKETDSYSLRWFTPDREIDLCGHATLATAFVLFHYYEPQRTSIVFQTKYSGQLRVTKEGGFYHWIFQRFAQKKRRYCLYMKKRSVPKSTRLTWQEIFFLYWIMKPRFNS